jgi:hypothetical protein
LRLIKVSARRFLHDEFEVFEKFPEVYDVLAEIGLEQDDAVFHNGIPELFLRDDDPVTLGGGVDVQHISDDPSNPSLQAFAEVEMKKVFRDDEVIFFAVCTKECIEILPAENPSMTVFRRGEW